MDAIPQQNSQLVSYLKKKKKLTTCSHSDIVSDEFMDLPLLFQ